MRHHSDFKWRHFEAEVILWSVRWYCKSALTYRNLQDMLKERGLAIVHTTVMRWVHCYAPLINKRIRFHLKKTNDSLKVDETYIKVKGQWKYLYRAIDSEGDTIDFMFSARRNKNAAIRFFKKILHQYSNQAPRVVSVDKHPAYPGALKVVQKGSEIHNKTQLRQVRYLNNRIEADHRFVKRKIRYKQWLQSFHAANNTIAGYEAMNMLCKGQVRLVAANDPIAHKRFVEKLFLIAA